MHLDDLNKLTNKIMELEKCKLTIDSYHDEDGRSGIVLKKIGGGNFTNLNSVKHEIFKIDRIHVIILL